MQRCPSGLRCSPGKAVCEKSHRGFESLFLRQTKRVEKAHFFYLDRKNRRLNSRHSQTSEVAFCWTSEIAEQPAKPYYPRSDPHRYLHQKNSFFELFFLSLFSLFFCRSNYFERRNKKTMAEFLLNRLICLIFFDLGDIILMYVYM